MPIDPAVKANAELVVRTCAPVAGFAFGYDEKSVQWLEGYIERLRASGAFAQDFDKFAGIFGSYLGEAIIRTHGGRWHEDEIHRLHVLFDDNNRAFPFAKVAKQMRNGLEAGESILGFFNAIPALLQKSWEKK
jgi:hypothetical protein